MPESNELTLAEPRKRLHLGTPEDEQGYVYHESKPGGDAHLWAGTISDEAVATWVDGGDYRLSVQRVGAGECDILLHDSVTNTNVTVHVTVPVEDPGGGGGPDPLTIHLGETF